MPDTANIPIGAAGGGGANTVKISILDVRPPLLAVMLLVPVLSAVAKPALLRVATALLLDAQDTDPEILPVLPSE